jgi:hypothetical protein
MRRATIIDRNKDSKQTTSIFVSIDVYSSKKALAEATATKPPNNFTSTTPTAVSSKSIGRRPKPADGSRPNLCNAASIGR